jgi:DNA topoisomerase I
MTAMTARDDEPPEKKPVKDEADFDESKHKRDDDGKFTRGGGATAKAEPSKSKEKRAKKPSAKSKSTSPTARAMYLEQSQGKNKKGDDIIINKWVDSDGNEITKENITDGKLPPPAWSDVWFDLDPKAKYVFGGLDGQGRTQKRRTQWFADKQSAIKQNRVNGLRKLQGKLNSGLIADSKSDDKKISDTAKATYLISLLGLRPGSEKDTKAKKQAYGATTLKSDHIHIDDSGKMNLRFTGKDGVDIDLDIENEAAYAMLKELKNTTEEGERIFPKASEVLARELVKNHTGDKKYKTKDLRTLKANDLAIAEISKREKPKNEKEYKALRNEVGDIVSKALGNTRTMALNEYIDKRHFEAIKPEGAK